ncbi:MAG: hypothetical protein PHV34_22425 [Verrucomicrobiae bacterium]|nr:hypothetical protein [Verrucomicrobiae bacterium]
MMMSNEDRRVLRDLAQRVAEIAAMPVMAERRDLWRRHNAMEKVRPVIYVNPQGSWGELVSEKSLVCAGEEARGIEQALRWRIHGFEHFASDNVVEAEWVVRKVFYHSGWGLTARRLHGADPRGAFGFDPVIMTPDDLKKIRFPEVRFDAAVTAEKEEIFQSLFGDILKIKVKGVDDFSYHLMNQYSALRGLQEIMVDMIENPQMVHDAMMFFEEGHRRVLRQYVEQDLLSLNNDNTPIYTSGHGYTDQLPRVGHDAGRVQPEDVWGWAEAQEMAAVSPEMHAEFAFPYEKRLLSPFGLNGYGCCDDVTRKLDFVLTIPHLRRVSVSPWANVDLCAQRIKGSVIFMWKPHPAHLVGHFDEEKVRLYLKHTVEVTRAHGCVLEIVLLDTHTCENHPERFDAWTRVAKQVVDSP